MNNATITLVNQLLELENTRICINHLLNEKRIQQRSKGGHARVIPRLRHLIKLGLDVSQAGLALFTGFLRVLRLLTAVFLLAYHLKFCLVIIDEKKAAA